MSLELMTNLVGGIGLFLLGMRLMTDGLQVAAGRALRQILAVSTKTRLRGVASGLLVTSLVQSSSAITVATIGFVNAGLLTLSEALAITYGSNVGTTMTGWLVATVGFHVDVQGFALPLVGLGMLLRITGTAGRRGPLGEAVAGFGLFFLGIAALKTAFETLGGQLPFAMSPSSSAAIGVAGHLGLVGIGFLLTVLMQSSSAALAIVMAAAGGGAIPVGAGAALVIGANLGTTSTAAFAVLGATPNAKRVAAGHIAFNVITGSVALALLPALLWLIVVGRSWLRLDSEAAAILAAFHTLFNLLGVALLWPLTDRLVRFLEARFKTSEEDLSRPVFLDRNVLATPHLALEALQRELERVGDLSRQLFLAALSGHENPARVALRRQALDALVHAIAQYAQDLQSVRLPAPLTERLSTVLRISRHYAEAAELTELVRRDDHLGATISAPELRGTVDAFIQGARELATHCDIRRADYAGSVVAAERSALHDLYVGLKEQVLAAGSRGQVPVPDVVELLDWLSNVSRTTKHLEHAAQFSDRLAHPDTADRPSASGETPSAAA